MSLKRLVFDTNVVMSALLFRSGQLAWLRDGWRHGAQRPIVSRETTDELIRVLSYPKFSLTEDEITDILADYLPYAEVHAGPVPARLKVAADPQDQSFIDLAMAAAADAIISGDRHLLALDGQDGLRVLAPVQLAELLQG